MSTTWILAMGAALLAAPFALAHDPAGTLKNYCEDPSDWSVHEYSDPPLMDVVLGGPREQVGSVKAVGPFLDGNVAGDCDGDGVPGDYDGHHEWSPTFWAMLTVHTVEECAHEPGHHPAFGPISVTDAVWGDAVPFFVGADYEILTGPCTDFVVEVGSWCIGTCTVTFPPGIDGAYYVGVCEPQAHGTFGHVVS